MRHVYEELSGYQCKKQTSAEFLAGKKENSLELYFNTRYDKMGKWVGGKGNPGNPTRQGPPPRLRAAGGRNTGLPATHEDSRPPLLPALLTPPSKPTIAAWLLHQFYTYRNSSPAKTPHTASTCYRYYRSVFKLHIYQGCNVTLKTHRKHMSLNSQTNHAPRPRPLRFPVARAVAQHTRRPPCTSPVDPTVADHMVV